VRIGEEDLHQEGRALPKRVSYYENGFSFHGNCMAGLLMVKKQKRSTVRCNDLTRAADPQVEWAPESTSLRENAEGVQGCGERTSRQPESMTSACPRPGISVNSVTPVAGDRELDPAGAVPAGPA